MTIKGSDNVDIGCGNAFGGDDEAVDDSVEKVTSHLGQIMIQIHQIDHTDHAYHRFPLDDLCRSFMADIFPILYRYDSLPGGTRIFRMI